MSKNPQYNQDQVNVNMEQIFDMTPTVNDKMKNIIRPEESRVTESISKQSDTIVKPKRVYKKKAPTRGGARKGAGRPKGSTTKITIEELLHSMENATGMNYGQRFATNYQLAVEREDWGLVKEYDKTILPKLVADKLETDITSNGETLGVAFNFPTTELAEWIDGPTKH